MSRAVIGFILVFVSLALATAVYAVPANPNPHSLQQPDGFGFQARLVGDENGAWFETLDGYTILKDSDDWWKFAELQGTALAPTGKVGLSAPEGIPRHSRPPINKPGPRIGKMSTPSLAAPQSAPVQPPQRSALTEGTSKTLVLMINFTDNPRVDASKYNVSWYDDLVFNTSNSGSMYTYYQEVSYGKHNVTGNATQWFNSSQSLGYWGNDTNTGAGLIDDQNDCIFKLAVEVINRSDAGINFSLYDDNSDGVIQNSELHILVVHAGQGQESSGVQSDIWSHKWTMYGSAWNCVASLGCAAACTDLVLDGVRLSANTSGEVGSVGGYTMLAEDSPMGTFAHEFCHDLGAADLYDTVAGSAVVGYWSLMDTGSWGGAPSGSQPVHLDGWHKYWYNWTTPTEIPTGTSGVLNLTQMDLNNTIGIVPLGGCASTANWTQDSACQYFLLEYRNKSRFDTYAYESGVVVWHIDNNIINSHYASNRINTASATPYPGVVPELQGGAMSNAAYNTGDSFNTTGVYNSSYNNGTSTGIVIDNLRTGSYLVDVNNNDQTPPSFTIQSPSNATYAQKWVYANLTGVSDAANCWVSLNGTANQSLTNVSGVWSKNLTVPSEGQNWAQFWCNDTAGNEASQAPVFFWVDTVYPVIGFTSPTPANNTPVFAEYVFVNASLSEVPAWIRLEWDNGTAYNLTMDGAGTGWYKNMTGLSDGAYTYRVWANDSAGNMNVSETRLVQVNGQPPSITVQSPANMTYNTTAVHFNITVDEVLTNAWFSVDGGANNTMGNDSATHYYNVSQVLGQGPHNVTFWANDTLGFTNWTAVWFTVDTGPPAVVPVSPVAGYFKGSITVNASATDTYSTVASVLYRWENGTDGNWASLTQSGNHWSGTLDTTQLGDGNYSVKFNATDAVGNENATEATANFTVDNTAPVITVALPANITYLYNVSLPLNFSIAEANLNASSCVYSLDGGANVSLPGCANSTFSTSDGQHNITVWAQDLAGSGGSATKYFTVNTSLDISVESPVNGSSYNSASTWFNVTASNPASWCGYSLNGGANITMQNDSATHWYNQSSAPEGLNNVTFYCNTTGGIIKSSSEVNFTTDLSPPEVVPGAPVPGWYRGSIEVNATVVDLTSISSMKYRWENASANGSWTGFQTGAGIGNTSYYSDALDSTGLDDGNYTIRFNATDTVGWVNATETVANVGVDNTAPTVLLPVYANATPKKSSDSLTLNISVSDAGSGLSGNCSVLVEGQGGSVNVTRSGSWCNGTVNLTGTSEGNRTINVWMQDAVGNTGLNDSYVVRIDNTAPAISNVTITAITNISALVSWTTDELADSVVDWGNNTAYGNSTSNTTLVLSHNVTLSGLNSSTKYYVMVNSTDQAGNLNSSVNYNFTTATVEVFNMTGNVTHQFNSTTSNVTIEIVTEENVTDANISVSTASTNPTNTTLGVTALDRYLTVTANDNLANNLSSALVKFYYTDAEVDAAGIQESSLKVYRFNATTSSWDDVTGGVNTNENYVWANVTGFSEYTMGGLKKDGQSCSSDGECAGGYCCSGSCSSSACPTDGDGGNGGGGGAGPTKRLGIVTAPDWVFLGRGYTRSFDVLVNNTGDANLTGVTVETDTDCAGCEVEVTPNDTSLQVGETQQFSFTLTVSEEQAPGTYSLNITVKVAGASNKTSMEIIVLECEPEVKMCVGDELETCKADGSNWTAVACPHGCDPVTLSCKPESVAVPEKEITPEGPPLEGIVLPDFGWVLPVTVVVVVVVIVIFIALFGKRFL